MQTPPLGSYAPADIRWTDVEAQLQLAVNYWLNSTRPDGRPHTVPIWGVWLDGAFYFYTEPQTQKVRNLTAQPEVVVHLESAVDVMILEGAVTVVAPASDTWRAVAQAFFDKYKEPTTGAGLEMGSGVRPPVVYELRPRHVRAWAHGNCFAQSHWHFTENSAPPAAG
ncbi:MAG TPA: pyridoxamine 5'-phosphate oxidase family protein [Chloroflexia bacterium]|nr:pyridoxamine 5'-phosphate oxidase family protein [Chloroflexia bacterium]